MARRRFDVSGWLVAVVLLGAVAASPAAAWEIEDPLHQNCHERLTAAALAQVGYRGAPPAELTSDEASFIDNQQFDASRYDRNIYSLALIIGTRSNDVRGLPDFALTRLAAAANEDGDQPAHCLRRLADDGASGDQKALQRCREFIENEVIAALQGTTADGIDPLATDDVEVYLPFVGTITYPLQRFYYHAGRALHALQDAFTHTYRDESWHQVLAVMNWVDPIWGGMDESRDGPPHETMLDKCDTDRPWRAQQLQVTGEASVALMQLLADADPGARDATHLQLVTLLDDWLGYEGGCSVENGYCSNAVYLDLKENGLSDGTKAGGCAAAGRGGAGGALACLALAGLLVLARRRRLGALLVAAVMLAAAPATAAPASQPASATQSTVTTTAPPGPVKWGEVVATKCPIQTPRWQLVFRGGGSITDPAVFMAAGGLFTWRRLEIEALAEWNPWFSIERGRTTAGSLNLYGVAGVRWLISSVLDLRSGLGAGISVLLFDLYGSPAGNVGPYLTVRPLGITRRFGSRLALTVDAFEVAVAMPQTRGWPVTRTQYRAAVGLRF